MSKLSDFYKFKDKDGLIQLVSGDPAPPTDNGALHTVEYFLALAPEQKKIDLLAIKKALTSLEVKTPFGKVTVRSPGNNRPNLIENVIALVIFSELFDGSRLSKELYKHGELTRAKRLDYDGEEESLKAYPIAWILNGFKPPNRFYNTKPFDWSIQTWWGKSPFFIGLLQLSAINRTSFIKKVALIFGLFSKNHRINYLVWQWLKKRNKKWNLLYKTWKLVVKYLYKTTIENEYKKHYKQHHPFFNVKTGEF